MSNIGYNHLVTIDENFMYVENLKLINDAFSNYIHDLPVSRVMDLIENTIVADADGQKYATSYHTIQSRFSSKYFGTCKGISIYSLTTNHISINAKVIGPNEHESHHLYDLIYNNKTNIPIDMVTGDGHSINQTSFVTLDSIDVEFIPSTPSNKFFRMFRWRITQTFSCFRFCKAPINFCFLFINSFAFHALCL